ncbi:MAG: hypothetical protein ACPL1B_10175 [Thermoprotei archaeon]
MPKKSVSVDCLRNFFNNKNKDLINQFKQFVKNKYATGNIPAGYPKNWQNYNRQLNRIISYYNGGGSQARSGSDAWSSYLRQDISDFIEHKINQNLADKGYIPAGRFDGVYSNIDVSSGDFYSFFSKRQSFSDINDLINASALYMADVPSLIAIYCTSTIFIANSSK